MHTEFVQRSKIDPFEFQNRSTYRDLLRLVSLIRELQIHSTLELSKSFLADLFHALFFVSKEVAYASIHEGGMLKMELVSSCVAKTFDCMTALDICFEARWIPSIQYFEAKQILEKAYWEFSNDQNRMISDIEKKFPIPKSKMKQFQ